MQTQTQPQLLVTAKHTAQILGCSVQTVRRLAEKGDLRVIRFGPGGHVRFRLNLDLLGIEKPEREYEADDAEYAKLLNLTAAA